MAGAAVVGLYVLADGRLVSVGTAPADVPAGHAVRALPAGAVYGVTHEWDDAAADWVPRPPVTTPVWSRGDWMDHMGGALEEVLHRLRLDPATPLPMRAALERMDRVLLRREHVDVTHPETIEAVPRIADVLVFAGALPLEGRAAFVARMLERRAVADV